MTKDNPFSDNPFQQSSPDANPFADPAPSASSTKGAAAATANPAAGAWGGGSSAWGAKKAQQPATASASIEPVSEGKSKREAELEKREAAVAAEEARLKKLEAELRAGGSLAPRKNWPRCYPVTHHDIAGDIPSDLAGMVWKVHWSYLALVLCLIVNLFGATMALIIIGNGDGRLTGWFLALIYFILGVPGAWIFWYKRLYNAAMKDRAMTYAWFFIVYLAHLAFSVWSAVAPPFPGTKDWSHTGFLTAVKAFDANVFCGACYIIGAGLWSIESLWSFWCMKTVYFSFRSSGGDVRLRREVATTAAQARLAGQVASRV